MAKLLIVEDNEDAREMLATLLSLEGFKVITAEDGRKGLDQAVIEQPDMIITDINMPVMNGVEMISRLRSREGFRCLPIIVLTAYSEGLARKALEAGADRAMSKPVDFDTFVRDLKQVCNSERCEDPSIPGPTH